MRCLLKTLAGLALLLLAGCQAMVVDAQLAATVTPFLPILSTPTPYLPLHPTLIPEATQPVEQPYLFHDIDFSPGAEEVTLRFWPADTAINRGRPIKVRFLPGSDCIFGDHNACVSHFTDTDNREIIWVSVHSGITGEGQELRHALEGTGINSAGLPIDQVLLNLNSLEETSITIQQGQKRVDVAQVASVIRVPAAQVNDYLSLPFDQALNFAVEDLPALKSQIPPGNALLVVETCGWRMPGEAGGGLVTGKTPSLFVCFF
ncbi:hypothetical protein FDZ74_15565, partial [bacterium]